MKETSLPRFPGTDRFEFVRYIGAGGMGVVYEAFDREHHVRLALKTLQKVNAATLYRFKQEFRSLAHVVHPNLVTLFQLISVDEQWFFTMELVDGCTFYDYVRPRGYVTEDDVTSNRAKGASDTVDYEVKANAKQEPEEPAFAMPVTARLTLEQYDMLRPALLQLAQGVHALHEAGKLHRDIKPSNVLVTPQGRVVVLDFGLVTELEDRAHEPSIDRGIAGTIAYMSPEQAAGLTLTEASDWYSVGAMLYLVLTGQAPFTGTKTQVVRDKQRIEPKLPADLAACIPEDLRTLCRDLLRLNPGERPDGAEILRRLGGEAAGVSAPSRLFDSAHAPFLGRERHMAVLHEALAALRNRRPAVVHVHGRSGAGKSLLVRRFLQDVHEHSNAVILSGRCFEQESVPYKALDSLIDSLTRYLLRLADHEAAVLMPRDVLALARLFPVLRRVRAVESVPAHGPAIPDKQELRRRAFGALREMLARLGDRRPLILVIDDLQWGDLDSAALLTDLLDPPDPPVLLMLICYRSEYAKTSPCLRDLIEAHVTDPSLDRRDLVVAALEPAESRQLALELLGPDTPATQEQADAIARESGGSPYFIHELAQHVHEGAALATTAQINLDEVLQQRVARLPADSRALLEAVAVSGKPLRQADAYHAAGLNSESPAPMTLLRVNHFVRSTGAEGNDEVETYHDRVRETVVAHLDDNQLRERHRSLAAVLETSGKADPETLAVHFQAADNRARAGHYYALAATGAADTLAFDRAAKLYRQSLENHPLQGAEERELRRKLADALANAGRCADAAREYQRIAAQTSGSESLELLGLAGYQFCAAGHIDEGKAALALVLGKLRMSLPSTRLRALLSMLWHRFKLWLRGLTYQERTADQLSADELARIDISWSVAIGLTMIDTIRGADFQTRNLLLALKAGEPYRVARALAWEATHAAMGGEKAKKRSTQLLDLADALVLRLDHPHALGMATMGRGVAAYFHGAWREAHFVCDRAVEVFRNRCTGVTWELDTSNAFAYWALWFRGELAEVIRRFPILVKEAHERGDRLAEANYTTFGGPFVWFAADDPDGARHALGSVMGDWSKQDFHVQHFTTLTARAQIELYKGDGPAAWQHIVEQWPLMKASALLHVECVRIFMLHLRGRCALAAAGVGDPHGLLKVAAKDARAIEKEKPAWCRGLALMLRASLAAWSGDRPQAARQLGEAAAALDAADMKLFAAAARRRQGELLGDDPLIAQADAFMTAQKIQNPRRMADLFVTGFGS
ncbi:MAG: protein kinase [Planctomycetes bacterium]|nr:protein kinase [Planctomycetota bacterium]